jgi:hypothetical protein
VARDASGNFSAGTITAALTGNASTASQVNVTSRDNTNETHYPTFTTTHVDGNTDLYQDSGFTYNPSSGTLTSTTFSGALSGNASTASQVNVTSRDSVDASHYPTFTTTDGDGNASLYQDAGFYYNPSSGTLTSTTFSGALSGNASTASQVNVTSRDSTNAVHYPTFTTTHDDGNTDLYQDLGFTYNPSTGTLTSTTFSGALSGNATTATTATNQSGGTVSATSGSFSGDISFTDSGTTRRGIQGLVGGSDYWFVGGGATASNAGYMEIASGDNGNEPIYARQYSGTPLTGTIQRTLTLLDGSGNSSFPGTVTATNGFTGDVTGNADTATQVYVTSRDSTNASHYPTFTTTDGDGNTNLYQDAGFYYNPSTGTLTSTVFSGTNGIFSGNVGIGTASPRARLDIYDPVTSELIVQGANNTIGTDTARIIIRNNLARRSGLQFQDDSDNSQIWHIGRRYANGGASRNLNFSNINDDALMTITNAGNIGIGTTNPDNKLEIADHASRNPTLLKLTCQTAPGGTGNESNTAIQLLGTNASNYGGYIEGYLAQSVGSGLKLGHINETGEKNEYMRIIQTGNVGIGTTNPGYTLDVAGNVHVTNLLTTSRAGFYAGYVIGTHSDFNLDEDNSIGTTSAFNLAPYIPYNNDLTALGPENEISNRIVLKFAFTVRNKDAGETNYWRVLMYDADTDVLLGTVYQSEGSYSTSGPYTATADISTFLSRTVNNVYFKFQIVGSPANLSATNITLCYDDTTPWYRLGANHGYFAGDVGIGTASPQTKLHTYVNGTGLTNLMRIQNQQSNSGCGIELMRGSGNTFGDTIWSDWRINNTQNLDFGVKFTGVDLPNILHLNTSGNVGIGTTNPSYKLDVAGTARFTGTVTTPKFSIDTNGTLTQTGDTNTNYIKLMDYFAAASNWKIATGSYGTSAWQWINIRAKMTRLDRDVKIIEFNSFGSDGVIRVRDSKITGGGIANTQTQEIKVYTKTGSIYEIYLQIDTATSVEVEISHRNSTIDSTYSTVAAGAINETGLTKIYDSSTTADFRMLQGNVGIGTASPGMKLQVEGTSVSTQELVKFATYYVRHHRSDGYDNLFAYDASDSDSQAFFDNRGNFLYVQIPAFSGETLYTHSITTYSGTYFQASLRDPNGVKPEPPQNTNYTIHVYSKRVDSLGNITTRGNVGIGTTNPGFTLDVNGIINATTGLRAPNGAGNFELYFEVPGSTLSFSNHAHKYFVISDMVFWYQQMKVGSVSGAGTVQFIIPVDIRPGIANNGACGGYWHTTTDLYGVHPISLYSGSNVWLMFAGAINNVIRLEDTNTIDVNAVISIFCWWRRP